MNEMTPVKLQSALKQAHEAYFPETSQVRRIWKWLSVSLPDTSGIFFRHKLTTLRVAELMLPGDDGKIDQAAIREQIERLKAEADRNGAYHEWSAAGEIEQLLIGLMDETTMKVEMRRYLADARRIGVTPVEDYEELARECEDEPVAYRATLVRLASEVQQRFRKRHILREFVAAYTARVSLLFFMSAAWFAGLLFLMTYAEYTISAAAAVNTSIMIGPSLPPELGWSRSLSPVVLALAAGNFGAAFSMMAQTRKRIEISGLEDMRTNSRMVMLLFRLCVGVGAAMIIFYVFDSGVLGESANFPNPQHARIDYATTGAGQNAVDVLLPNSDLSLLLVWCFIAGFSEVLVPSILQRAEGGVANAHRS